MKYQNKEDCQLICSIGATLKRYKSCTKILQNFLLSLSGFNFQSYATIKVHVEKT